MPDEVPTLTVENQQMWFRWLADHGSESPGVWLVLAKKGTTNPTSLTYEQALEGAISFGWVDGQLAKVDDQTFRRRFTPRKTNGSWSRRNVALAERLIREGRMQTAGFAAIERAKATGSWEHAYEGQASIEVPEDLASALNANDAAKTMFAELTAANRYAILYRVATAKRAETRQGRIEKFVDMLARGETIHPNHRTQR